jgi:hypothetical protein
VRTYSLGNSLERHPEITQRRVSVAELRNDFGFRSTPDSTRALLIRMGPFDAAQDGFLFTNSFQMTAVHATELVRMFRDEVIQPIIPGISSRYTEVLADLSFDLLPFLPGGEVGLPDFVVSQVGARVSAELIAQLADLVIDPFGSDIGHCGGMAFAGYDLYQQGWPVHNLGTVPPTEGDVGDYIFARLIDSLELNARKFLRWVVELHMLPKLNVVADAALVAAASIISGSLGLAVSAWLATQGGVFHLGGPGSLLEWTRDEWTTLKARLDRQAAWPIGLVYGDTANPFDQHQVLAIGYDDIGSGLATLRIWNNNELRKPNTLQLDFTGNTLQVSGFTDPNGHTIRGLFAESYTRSKPPSSLFRP